MTSLVGSTDFTGAAGGWGCATDSSRNTTMPAPSEKNNIENARSWRVRFGGIVLVFIGHVVSPFDRLLIARNLGRRSVGFLRDFDHDVVQISVHGSRCGTSSQLASSVLSVKISFCGSHF